MIRDDLGAFMAHCDKVIEGPEDRLLSGLTLAVKDIFDVEGCRTGCGSPDWLRTHEAAEKSAPVVEKLIDAGIIDGIRVDSPSTAISRNTVGPFRSVIVSSSTSILCA